MSWKKYVLVFAAVAIAIAMIVSMVPSIRITGGSADPSSLTGPSSDTEVRVPWCPPNAYWDESPRPDVENISNGSDMIKSVSAEGFWYHVTEYNWTVLKMPEVDPSQVINLPPGESTSVSYTISADRSLAYEADLYGVKGNVRLNNISNVTPGAKIIGMVHVLYGGCNLTSTFAFPVNTTCPTVPFCEDPSFPFEFAIVPIAGASYQVEFLVDNCTGGATDPSCYSAQVFRNFTLPSEPTPREVDLEAVLYDEMLPSSLDTALDDSGPWVLTGPEQRTVTATIWNNGTEADKPFAVVDRAKLVESDTKQVRLCDASICIATRSPPGPQQCQPDNISVSTALELASFQTVDYGWNLTKQANTSAISSAQSSSLTYWMNATREVESTRSALWTYGTITVSNNGACPLVMDGLEATVEMDDASNVVPVETREKPILCPGETHSYRFQLTDNDSLAQSVKVTPQLGSGSDQPLNGPSVQKNVPAPQVSYIDQNAQLAENITGSGLTWTVSPTGPWELTDNTSVQVDVLLTRTETDGSGSLNNVATLIENDSHEVRSAFSNLSVSNATTPPAPAPTPTPPPGPIAPPSDCLTNVSGYNNVTANSSRTVDYDWTIVKTANQSTVSVQNQQTGSVMYWLNATRDVNTTSYRWWVDGNVTVNNTGTCPTSGLNITLAAYRQGNAQPVAIGYANTSARPQLQAGESWNYSYSMPVSSDQASPGRVQIVATVSLNNSNNGTLTDSRNVTFGPPVLLYHDANASIEDELSLPSGYVGQLNQSGPWVATDNVSVPVMVNITNDNGANIAPDNTARLTEADSGRTSTSVATVSLMSAPPSGPVAPPPTPNETNTS